MLKARGRTADGRPLVILGLERGNIERLQAGQPIKFDLSEVGMVGECIILFGETAQDILAEFSPIGSVNPAGAA